MDSGDHGCTFVDPLAISYTSSLKLHGSWFGFGGGGGHSYNCWYTRTFLAGFKFVYPFSVSVSNFILNVEQKNTSCVMFCYCGLKIDGTEFHYMFNTKSKLFNVF